MVYCWLKKLEKNVLRLWRGIFIFYFIKIGLFENVFFFLIRRSVFYNNVRFRFLKKGRGEIGRVLFRMADRLVLRYRKFIVWYS